MAPKGVFGDEQAYLFDLMGFVVIEQALTAAEVARLNTEIDRAAALQGGLKEYPRRLSGQSADGGRTPLAGDTAMDPLGRPEGRHRLDLGGMLAWEQPHCEPFRELLCHASVKPYLDGVLGDAYRLDHGPGLIAMEPGTEGGTLHHGSGDMDDLSFAYTFTRSGKIRTGLTVAEYLLADEGPGDGGFAIVVGSHKANLPMPRSLSLMADHTHAVTEVCGKAGDCIVFTETCSHGTLPWRGKHQRRALLYKFSPGHASFGTGPHSIEYPPWIRSMKPEQAAVMIAPYGAGARKELPATPKL